MPTAGIPQSDNTSPNQRFVLGEEEMADVSLATFHLFDTVRPMALDRRPHRSADQQGDGRLSLCPTGMKTLFLGVGACALAIALLAALGGALRPLLLTALLGDQHWARLLFGAEAASWLDAIPTIYAVLILELVEGAALIALGTMLSRLAAGIGRAWRSQLAQAGLHTMASDAGERLGRYVALTKTYVEVVEQFFRQYLVELIAALVQLIVSLAPH